MRHIKRDRKRYVEALTRCGRATKIRRGDLFCLAWVDKIKMQAKAFANPNDDREAIKAHIENRYGQLTKHTPKKQTGIKWGDFSAWHAGQDATNNVAIHRPVQAKSGLLLSSGSNKQE